MHTQNPSGATPSREPTRLADYQPSGFRLEETRMRVQILEACVEIHTELQVAPRQGVRQDALVLHGEDLTTLSVEIDGVPHDSKEFSAWIQDGRMHIPGSLLTGDRHKIKTHVSIDPWSNQSFEGLYASGGQKTPYLCTQCEAEGFRRITWYPDRPDMLSVFRVRIEADRTRYPLLLSNGGRGEQGALPDGRHFVEWIDPHPKPCYLFALVAGDLAVTRDRFVTKSGREVQLDIYTEPDQASRADHAIRSLIRAMRWDEQRFGLEYDLDLYMIVAVSDFNMGAMENKGLNIFNARYVLADPQTATDGDYIGIDRVIAHEYFHNWTGNRVTCRDWFQLSLKEGLTVLRDQLYTSEQYGMASGRIDDVLRLQRAQFMEDAGPLAHPVQPDQYLEINNFYTTTIYEKGAELIRMQRELMGEDRFGRAIALYLERHDGEAATIEDFVRAMEEAGELDLAQFRRWYRQAGTPRVQVTRDWNPATGELVLTFRQSCPPTPGQPVKEELHIPVVLGLLSADGEALAPEATGGTIERVRPAEGVFALRRETETLHLSVAQADRMPVVSLFRGFSAPVQIEDDLTPRERALLSACDPDPFARWNAGYALVCETTQQVLACLERGEDPASLSLDFLSGWEQILEDRALDPALKARMLILPSLGELFEATSPAHPALIYRARAFLRAEIGRRLHRAALDQLALLDPQLDALPADQPPSPEHHALIGLRALRHRCLALLGWHGRKEDWQQIGDRFDRALSARSMTDLSECLFLIAQGPESIARPALEKFAGQWQGNALVMDKWLAARAASEGEETLETVRGLLQHPAFDLRNPNRIRALIGTLAASGEAGFHRPDGEGYRFVADCILEIDAKNPQVAARLANAFGPWRRFAEPHRSLMQRELTRIGQSPGISRDSSDIVSRALAG